VFFILLKKKKIALELHSNLLCQRNDGDGDGDGDDDDNAWEIGNRYLVPVVKVVGLFLNLRIPDSLQRISRYNFLVI
jgi:hypothetical protein